MGTTFFIKAWERIRTSFWFVPSLMILGSIVFFVATISLDYRLSRKWAQSVMYIYTGGPEGARALLSTVAGSMMTVTGVVFSVTVVAFTLASQQFSPRLLRNFMRDPGNQFVLGTFMSTFVYCLLVLRTVRQFDGEEFIPHVSVTCATLLAILNIGVLVYFVHHAASSIQAPVIIANVAADLDKAIDRLFPLKMGDEGRHYDDLSQDQQEVAGKVASDGGIVGAPFAGYLQGIDESGIMKFAAEKEIVICCLHRPGDFLAFEQPMVKVWPPGRLDDAMRDGVRSCLAIGGQRTQAQDLEFVIQQLVEIALRALSPSLNDPFTACACIERIRDAFTKMVMRDFPKAYRLDEEGALRVVTHATTLRGMLDAAFNHLRQSGVDNAAVAIRLLEAIEYVGRHAKREGDRRELLRQAEMIERGCRETIAEMNDRADIQAAFDRAVSVLV